MLTCQVLMEAGIKVNVEDAEGNTTLHVKCYGETGNLSELDAIDMLIANGADLTIRNNRVSNRKFLWVIIFFQVFTTFCHRPRKYNFLTGNRA